MEAPGSHSPRAAHIEELDRAECLALLAAETVGRLAINAPAGPLVVPVNYLLVDETIVFRSGPGTKLRSLGARPVSFEVDGIDPVHRTGWSVLARGRAREVSARQFQSLALDSWAPREQDHWVAMTIATMTGRRIRTAGSET